MIDLQNNGITINIVNQEYRIYFHFYGLIGDNLELYSILGFNEIFRSLYPYRIFLITRDDSERITYEKKKLYRTNKDHANHIKKKFWCKK